MIFDENQRAVIEAPPGSMLVTAGPGSGKTAVLTHRIRYLNEKYKIPYEKILVITFTKAAAKQMKSRFESQNECESRVTFCTFHSFFYSIIKDFDNSEFSIISQNEKLNILKTVLLDEDIDVDHVDTGILLDEISKVKNLDRDIADHHSVILEKERFLKIYTSYENEKRARKLLDYDDFVLFAYEIFEKDRSFFEKWKKKYEYCLIDEFQDINYKQYSLVIKLFKDKKVFAVGDEDQSIYAFRGSSSDICIKFKKDFNADVYKLVTNYRSSKKIVESSVKLISNNTLRFDKQIVSSKDSALGECFVRRFDSYMDEYDAMADLIKEGSERGKSIAVLLRTNNIPDALKYSFLKKKVEFVSETPANSNSDSECIKDILTYFKLSTGENTYKNLLRIANKPNRYISREFLSSCKEKENKYDDSFSYVNLYRNSKNKTYLATNIFKLEKHLKELKKLSSFEGLMYVLNVIGYEKYLFEKKSKCLKDIEEIKNLCREFESKEELTEYFELMSGVNEKCTTLVSAKSFDGNNIISSFLNDKKGSDNNSQSVKANENDICKSIPSIITIHAAKGREWDEVYIPDLNEGNIPHKKAVSKEEIEEERRLFYVAMTRAKEKLFIGCVKDIERNVHPSLFFEELKR
ncbi:MAG: ATP-dependent helicase [Lachnospiraceae bacterium]|nr:ATP-dependent helicase [Lachnospiraceae bacterium]